MNDSMPNPYHIHHPTKSIPTNARFWVGVNGHASHDHRPAPRGVGLYAPKSVFNDNGTLVFECDRQFYVIPSEEENFIQEWKDSNMTKKTIAQPKIANFPTSFEVSTSQAANEPTSKAATKPEPKATKRRTNAKAAKPKATKPKATTPATNPTMPKPSPAKGKADEPKITVGEIKRRFYAGAALVGEMYGDEPCIDTPVNPANQSGIVNRDPKWNEAVRVIAHEFGWTSNLFVYGGAIRANGGKIKPGAYGVPSFIGGMFRLVYNIDDVVWENGLPTEWAKYKRTPKKKRTSTKAKAATNPEPKATPKAPTQAATKVIRVTLPNGIVLEATSMEELKQLKEMFC